MSSNPRHEPIAVVGVSALFPGSLDATGFWKDILRGTDLMTDVPPSHWFTRDYYDPDPTVPDHTYANRGAFLKDVPFDPVEWGVPPSIVSATDTCQLLALVVAQKVLEDATRGQPDRIVRDRTSVILGVTGAQELMGAMVGRLQRPIWKKALEESGLTPTQVEDACNRISSHYVPWQENTFPGLLGNVVAGRIANRLNLGGTNCVTDAACASTLSALSMAVNELRLGDSDMVITGGADTMNDVFMFICFSKTPALSRTGDCRPFSADADGTMLGEGLGMVALKRLSDAQRDQDQIYAVIKSVGASSDGRAKSVYAPLAEGQAKALRRAYANAGHGPDTVEMVEAHGTGTPAGDAAEFEGLSTVFNEVGKADRQWCALGSIKSQVGHTKAAAGAAGLFKTVMALHHRVLPPTIKVDKPNPALNLQASPFYLSTHARPWVRGSKHPRRASVSAFGFGGSNFHVALEERTGTTVRAGRLRTAADELVVLCAPDAATLANKCVELAADAKAHPGLLPFAAWSSQNAYDASAGARLAVVAASNQDLEQKLTAAAERLRTATNAAFTLPGGVSYGTGPAAGDVALLFPGQGSQYVNMGADVAMAHDDALATWDAVADLPMGDTPLHDVVFPHPVFDDAARAEQTALLTRTEWAQPAIGATSLATLALLRRMGLKASATGGHSFGEVTALAAADALSTADAMRAARQRGELMAAAARHPGTMTAVVADVDTVKQVLAQSGANLTVANHNGPREVVVSGAVDAVAAFEGALGERSIRFKRLEVATAFHSPIVRDAVGPFGDFLQKIAFTTPSMTVFGNARAEGYPDDPTQMRNTLASQLGEPVRFVDMVLAMYASGCRVFVEAGPGAVLTGLVGRILEGKPHVAVATDRKGRDGLSSLHEAMARLVAAGVRFAPAALWQEYAPPTDPRTRKVPKLTMPINGSNYGKIYPPNPLQAGVGVPPRPSPSSVLPALAPANVAPSPTPPSPTPSRPVPPPPPRPAEAVAPARRTKTALPRAGADAPIPVSDVRMETPRGLKLNSQQLQVHSSGRISSIYGPQFADQDGFEVQVRMPEPPLLLADRLTGLDAEPNSMGTGKLWTESDIKPDAWYLHCGRMPTGILIESGQADLMLVSWLGIDLLNRGQRRYRLLGCDLTFHDSLPAGGETLTYQIHGDGFANHGDIRLFFFHYDCVVNGRPLLSVREGQAGFFTNEELAGSAGVLWSAEEDEMPTGRLDPARVSATRRSFSGQQVQAFSEGRTYECFGPGYERAETHTRTPAMSSGRMRFIDHVTDFDVQGGPWKRGYLRAETPVTPQDWFFNGHFKNDPCMPGTLMYEATLQTMAFYMAGLGVTLDNDGYRFEPVTNERYKLRCRGQVTPTSKNLVYEVFVREFQDGPVPVLYADLLVTVDGLKAFYCRRMGLRLVPDWPLTSKTELLRNYVEPKPVAVVDGFPLDYKSLLSCAWGKPSEAFGPFYTPYDGPRRVPRLPGPPYHFMSRVLKTSGKVGGMEVGSKVEVEYDVPPDAWYFQENGAKVMPYCVLLEAVLQPCGWLASFVGSALTAGDQDLAFRNLDGKGRVLAEVKPDAGSLVTTSEITNISRAGTMVIESFKVTCRQGNTPVYELTSVFGFFSADALANQTGLPLTPAHRALIDAPSNIRVDLTARPERYFRGHARLPDSKLLMIDRVVAFDPAGGKKGLGFLRSEKDVTPSEWFLKAHFFQDPVQPGSLGMEAMEQLLQFAMLQLDMDRAVPGSRFQGIEQVMPSDAEHVWKYRGQVVLTNKRVSITMELTARGTDERGPYVRADASLWVDGKRIYEAVGVGMRLVRD